MTFKIGRAIGHKSIGGGMGFVKGIGGKGGHVVKKRIRNFL